MKRIVIVCVLIGIAAIAAAVSNVESKWVDGNLRFFDGTNSILDIKSSTDGVQFHQAVEFDGAVDFDSTLNLNGALTLGAAQVLTASAVSLTSPTVTFSAAGKNLVVLNSDANQTGIYPTGGTQYQVLSILSGAGSNTMRVDDGTSMTIGANITLTEGQGDVLTLLCTNAEGDEWTAFSAHDN